MFRTSRFCFSEIDCKIKLFPVIKQSDGRYVINDPIGDGDTSGDYKVIIGGVEASLEYVRGDGVKVGDSVLLSGPTPTPLELAVSFPEEIFRRPGQV